MRRLIEIPIGTRFGRLVVTGRKVGKGWKCRCDCGRVVLNNGHSLRSGVVLSCGCKKREELIKKLTTHGETGSPEHKAWENMIVRCENTKTSYYKDYGGRGISVCPRWRKSFAFFLKDMGRRPSPKHELDRYPDNDGEYEPGNCRWATRRQQLRNRRNSPLITIDGETRHVNDWAAESKVHPATILARIAVGRPPAEAVFDKPLRKNPVVWEDR